MGRTPRIHFDGAVFHVMSRGNGGQLTFLDDADRATFLRMVGAVKEGYRFRIYGYCLMSNHFHFIMRVGARPISLIMQTLLTRYANFFNARHDRKGHVFQSRFKAIHCGKDSYLLELLRYIHLNPVRAKLVDQPAAWSWSGHAELLGKPGHGLLAADFPLSLFHSDAAHARSLYRQFVLDGVSSAKAPSESGLVAPDASIGREVEADAPGDGHSGADDGLESFGETVAAEHGVPLQAIRGAGCARAIVRARHELIRRAIAMGRRPTVIAAFLNRSPSAISKTIGEIQRFKV